MPELQLDLFQWHMIAVAEGYRIFASLEFVNAKASFARVLQAVPDHRAATNGIKEVRFWEDTFAETRNLDSHSTFRFLWEKINSFHFSNTEGHELLRQSLIRYLVNLMEDDPDFYDPPDFCRGYLYFLLGDFAAAEENLLTLTEKYPENGRLIAWLAEALFMQGKGEKAGVAYTKSLLLAPHDVPVESLHNGSLVNVIREHGPELAPVYGYLEGVLPAVTLDIENPTDETRIFTFLLQAEQAMGLANHEAMVDARRGLKRLAPAVLRDYLSWLKQ